jgi:RES domain-containing protein
VYEGRITKPLHDIRGNKFDNLYHPDDRIESQRYGKAIREKNSWGVIYNSIRHTDGICIAAFRPPAVSIPKQTLHLKYHWNGVQIAAVSSTKILMEFG